MSLVDFLKVNYYFTLFVQLFRSGASFAFQVSDTLDYLLVKQGYNKQMRPENSPGEPVEVVLNLVIRNIGPIDELKEVFSIDCYFRQTWYDNRLQFNTRCSNYRDNQDTALH